MYNAGLYKKLIKTAQYYSTFFKVDPHGIRTHNTTGFELKASGLTECTTWSIQYWQAAEERLRCENEMTKNSYLAF